jgi:hypothetical protein
LICIAASRRFDTQLYTCLMPFRGRACFFLSCFWEFANLRDFLRNFTRLSSDAGVAELMAWLLHGELRAGNFTAVHWHRARRR